MSGVDGLIELDLDDASLAQTAEAFRRTALIDRLLRIAVEEDTGGLGVAGDRTSQALGADGSQQVTAALTARAPGILAGLEFVPDVLRAFGAQITLHPALTDGQPIEARVPFATLHAPLSEVVVVERTILNLLGRLCGIATATGRFVQTIAREAPGSPTRLYDTRKTTPGLRLLEKYAVRCGGGQSHRLGLHDAVMLKDNHIAQIPDKALPEFVRAASERARAAGPLRFFEVEVDRLEQLDALLTLPDGVVDIILLDNMPPDRLAMGVQRRDAAGRRVLLEASGGVALDTIGAIARTRVDRVSTGALTHASTWLDIGLDIEVATEPRPGTPGD
ncbi:MAG: carboxylating nicotinate-nucleotide diphosphorylase [Phycisphaerales bacterium]